VIERLLQDLAAVDGIIATLITDQEGLIRNIFGEFPPEEVEGIAATSHEILGDPSASDPPILIVLRGKDGAIVCARVGISSTLTILCASKSNIGEIRLCALDAAERISRLFGEAA